MFRTLGRLAPLLVLLAAAPLRADPLPSWNDGQPKRAIVDFVTRVTQAGGPQFVPPELRIAVFDNDGTLWAEQPYYFQFAFAIDRVKAMAPQRPAWKQQQPFKAVLEGDLKSLAASGQKSLLALISATHTGMSTEEFTKAVADWTATARHPRFNRLYTELVYQPQIELLSHLRANGFKTFIVSGGGVEFMRPWVERVYGIPPEQVVGSSGVIRYQLDSSGRPALFKENKVEFIDDGPDKPVGINRFIGRRPILAFGNSDGDYEMLLWTTSAPGPRLGLIVHHTDADREWAYDRQSHIGRLDKALSEAPRRGWVVVDMKKDWKVIFPERQ